MARTGGPGRGCVCPVWVLFSPPGQHRGRAQHLPSVAGAGPLVPSNALPQQTKGLGDPELKDGVDKSHILSSSLQVGLIYFGFHCAWVVHTFHISIIGKLTSLRIKL